jgi:hypothetical protein
MVGEAGLEIPVNAANPALKQRQRGKPFVKRTTATLRPHQGARDKATLTPRVLLDGQAKTLMRLRQRLKELFWWVPARSIFSNAQNFCRSAIAALQIQR